MQYFVGIVPPKEIYEAIQAVQKPFGDNRLEPPITLLPPTQKQGEQYWLQQIKQVLKQFQPFSIKLNPTGQFGSGVLFIGIDSPKMEILYKNLVSKEDWFIPVDELTRSRSYHPHLTLGRAWCGFTQAGFTQMKVLANQYVEENQPQFLVSALRVYHKPVANSGYLTLTDLPLG